MSKGTDKLAELMDQHEVNAKACQTANSAKSTADSAFRKSAQDVKDATLAVTSEAAQLATDAGIAPDQSNTSILDVAAPPVSS